MGEVSVSPFTRSRESAWRFHQGHKKVADLRSRRLQFLLLPPFPQQWV